MDKDTERINQMEQVLKEINSRSIRMDELVGLIREQNEKDYDIFYLTFPNDGTRHSFEIGTTILDFENGTIKSPSGVVDKMSSSLKKVSRRSKHKDFMRSFAINTDQEIVVQLDDGNKTPVRANVWGKMTHQMYTKARITCTVATTGYVHACTNPEAVHEQIGETTIAVGREERKTVVSDKDVHFTELIAQNGNEQENLNSLDTNEITIVSIGIQSDQPLFYRLWIFETDGFDDADLDEDSFLEFVDLDLITNSVQLGGANQYYFAITNLNIDYVDLDETKELHLALENLSATDKNAGATGEVVLQIKYVPRR